MKKSPELALDGADQGPFLRAEELQDRIAAKYPAPSYTTLCEVRDGTGFATSGREADVMAFGTWPSRGLSIVGFEIKSYRGDWLREMKNPEKAEGIASFCDEWWLVTGGGVARLEEIPPAWGWYQGTAKGLRLMKSAKVLEAKPITRVFLMSIMRNLGKSHVPASRVNDLAKNEADEIVKRRGEENRYELEEARNLAKLVAEFKEASGIDLAEPWSFPAKEVGAIVKACLDKSLIHHAEKMKQAAESARDVLEILLALPIFQEAERLLVTKSNQKRRVGS